MKTVMEEKLIDTITEKIMERSPLEMLKSRPLRSRFVVGPDGFLYRAGTKPMDFDKRYFGRY